MFQTQVIHGGKKKQSAPHIDPRLRANSSLGVTVRVLTRILYITLLVVIEATIVSGYKVDERPEMISKNSFQVECSPNITTVGPYFWQRLTV